MVNDLGTSVAGVGEGRDADQVVKLIQEAGGAAIADYGNIADEAAVTALFDAAAHAFGRVDVVVNNAGIVRDKVIWNMPAAEVAVMRVIPPGPTALTVIPVRYSSRLVVRVSPTIAAFAVA